MISMYKIFMTAALMSLGVTACTGADGHEHVEDHGHTEAANHEGDSHGETSASNHDNVDHDKFGHLSAIYLCGDHELQTTHTDKESKLAYKGFKIDVTRRVSIVDNAFAGESFKGELNGQSLIFRGKGYDASLKIGDEVMSCEKISCIPLGGPH